MMNNHENETPRGAPLLAVRNARKIYGAGFFGGGRRVTALRDVSLTLSGKPARITAVAGESGSGKSTLAGAVLGFIRLDQGQVLFHGQDVAVMSRRERFEYRRAVQAVFQDPYAVFNPFYHTDHIFNLVMRRFHIAKTRRDARARIVEALDKVGLRPDDVLGKHPHQLSGGQRQRVMIARACLMTPRLIVADEPVSMVDASLRSMILDIMLRLRDEDNISFLYITHDLSTAFQISDDIHIFYQGALVESGPVDAVLGNPRHPYTQLLIESIPAPDPDRRWEVKAAPAVEETAAGDADAACPFQPRCPRRMDQCKYQRPAATALEGTHNVACHLFPGNPSRK